MTGGRMDLLKIHTLFPPRRKWMEVHNQHPSCLHPLSRGEGVELMWILNNCYCFSHSGSAHILVCGSEGTRNSPHHHHLFTKGQIFDPVCFCCSVLRPHSFEFSFQGIYREHYLRFGHTGLCGRPNFVCRPTDFLS